jgi:hypothetical protein
MILIAHRGNTNGPNPDRENKPDYIMEALKQYDVEVDVWYKGGKLYLGHDGPETEIDVSFLQDNRIWCHAKNAEALAYLLQHFCHVFAIQENDFTLTSRCIIYGYSRIMLPANSVAIAIDVETLQDGLSGVCTDYPDVIAAQSSSVT